MKLHDIIEKSQGIINDAVVAEQVGDLKESRNQMQKLLSLMQGPIDLPEEQPAKTESEKETADLPAVTITEDQRLSIINEHIKHLPANITIREQVIASAEIFIPEIKEELAFALNCEVYKVPEVLADYLGFTEQRQAIADAKKESKPDAGVISEPAESENKDGSGVV